MRPGVKPLANLLQIGRQNSQALWNWLMRVPRLDERKIDPVQRLLLDDKCIVVDHKDFVIGTKTKRDCHYLGNNSITPLHRAFSVFLFNSKNELLLQQRSMCKVTFPGKYSNTCCSHPSYVYSELEEKNALGVKRAAQHRLQYELGISPKELTLDDLFYLTRFHYFAASNDHWAEHEIDYVFIARKDVTLHINPNEVQDYRYVSKEGMEEFLENCESRDISLTPWFHMILQRHLFDWWENLNDLSSFVEHDRIQELNFHTMIADGKT